MPSFALIDFKFSTSCAVESALYWNVTSFPAVLMTGRGSIKRETTIDTAKLDRRISNESIDSGVSVRYVGRHMPMIPFGVAESFRLDSRIF